MYSKAKNELSVRAFFERNHGDYSPKMGWWLYWLRRCRETFRLFGVTPPISHSADPMGRRQKQNPNLIWNNLPLPVRTVWYEKTKHLKKIFRLFLYQNIFILNKKVLLWLFESLKYVNNIKLKSEDLFFVSTVTILMLNFKPISDTTMPSFEQSPWAQA